MNKYLPLLICLFITAILFIITQPCLSVSKPASSKDKAPAIKTTPGKQPILAPQKGKPRTKIAALPDLVVTSIDLDNVCKMTISIKNIGKGMAKPEELQQAKIELNSSGRSTELLMSKLSRFSASLRPGASITLNTNITLEESGIITAEVDSQSIVAESNEKNNSKRTRLHPRCASVLKNKKIKSRSDKQKQTTISGKKTRFMSERIQTSDISGEDDTPVFLEDENWLIFEDPYENTRVHSLEMEVVYYLHPDVGDGPTPIQFRLKNDAGETVAQKEVQFRILDGERTVGGGRYLGYYKKSFFWVFHSNYHDIPNGSGYILSASMTDRSTIESEAFQISFHSDRTRLFCQIPSRDTTFYTDNADFMFSCFTEPESILENLQATLLLYPETEAGDIPLDHTRSHRIYTYMDLADIEPGEYRIRMTGTQDPGTLPAGTEPLTLTGTTRFFTIAHRPPEPEPEESIVDLYAPVEGSSVYIGAFIRMRWRVFNFATGDFVRRRLLQGGSEIAYLDTPYESENSEHFDTSELEEGEYQVEIQHRRRPLLSDGSLSENNDEAEILNSAAATIHLITPPDHRCTESIPVKILDLFGSDGPTAVGSPVTIHYCLSWSDQVRIGDPRNQHVRIELIDYSDWSPGTIWLLGDNIHTPVSGGTAELMIPEDVPPGDRYRFRITHVESGASSEYPLSGMRHSVMTINPPE